jgi:hypothetical protein
MLLNVLPSNIALYIACIIRHKNKYPTHKTVCKIVNFVSSPINNIKLEYIPLFQIRTVELGYDVMRGTE